MQDQVSKYKQLGERALRELRLYWVITAYLVCLLGSFALYGRVTQAQVGADYLTYGFKLVEALLIGKLILIAQAIGLGRSYEKHPLLVSISLKSLLFALFIVACNVLEQAIHALFKGADLAHAVTSFTDKGLGEMFARTLVLMVTLVPLITFLEIARVLGPGTMSSLFFSRREALRESAS